MGIYVHVPFCVHKCGYCDFNSWAEERRAPQNQWLLSLEKQLKYWSKELHDREYETVFFGGGTPSLLENDLILRSMNLLREHFRISANAEITWEVNPETLTLEKLDTFQKAGINRLSLGVQSFQDGHLERLERRARREDNLRALNLLAEHWRNRWSLDLMFGLPGQDLENWRSDLRTALEFQPRHLSAYQLTLTTERSKNWKQPGEDVLLELLSRTIEDLEGAGLHHYEVSNFSVAGHESRHNLKYWQLEGFLGLGPGAAGLLPGRWLKSFNGSEEGRWGYHQKNPDTFEKWSSGAGSMEQEMGRNLQPRNACMHLEELLMMGLRLKRGIKNQRLGAFLPWLRGSIFEEIQGHTRLTVRALPLLNTHLEDIFLKIEEFEDLNLDSAQIDPTF